MVELASNDGYLLQYFVERGIPALGVEPAANVARAAVERGVPTEVRFFGVEAARDLVARRGPAHLLLGNNVLAQVPDLNDFVGGMPILLAPDGVLTLEFPHLVRLVEGNQFDTIYHEHFSYFSLTAVRALLARHGLALFDVEELASHGGSLRIYAHHAADTRHAEAPAVGALLAREAELGLGGLAWYGTFAARVRDTKHRLADLPDRRQGEGQDHRRLRRPRQGEHPAQLLRHPHRLSRLHGRPQPVQARPLPARHAHPHPSAGAHRRDPARLRPHHPVEPREGDRGAARVHQGLGRPLRVPIPAVRVLP